MRSVDEYITLLLDEPHKKNLEQLDQYDSRLASLQESRPTELSQYAAHMSKLEKFNIGLDSVKFSLSLDVVLAKITDDLAQLQDDWLQEQERAFESVDEEITNLKVSIEESNKKHNEYVLAANRQGNVGFETLENKRKILEGYSDKIFDICSQYGITTSDVGVDETMFTPEELGNLYDEYIKFMQKEENSINPITFFKEHITDITIQAVLLGLLIFLCFTPVLNVISIAFFAALIYNQIKEVGKSKYYGILMAITFNVKPENMGYVALDTSQLLPEELTPEMMDEDERFAAFEQKYIEVESQMEENNPSVTQAKVTSEWSSKLQENQKKLAEYQRIFDSKVFRIKSDICAEIAYMKKEYEKLKAAHKFLGQRFSKKLTFNGTFTFGIHDEVIEETVNIGQKNIIIRPSIDSTLMNKFLQVLYTNAIANVFPGKLKVTVYDPNNFGRAIMPLYSNELRDYISFYNDELNKILEEHVTYVQDNFKIMAGKTIEEYNTICEQTGKTPIEYRLIMVLSQPKTIEEDEKLQSLFEYSATGGVFIWIVSESMMAKDAFIFRKPFEGVDNPITNIVTDNWCEQVKQNYAKAIEDAKPKGLLWQDFIGNVLPSDKTWTGDASKFIDFYPGYEEGDPAKYKPYTLGNEGNVHAIGVGTSGAGKSVFLNHIIGTMCRKYDPKQLELWLCDFKGVEFKAYMKTPRAKAARLCKPIKAGEGYVPRVMEKSQEVLGYYEYNEETKEYIYSDKPTKDCDTKHIFMQELKNGKPKEKGGKVLPPLPKADTAFADNMESYCLPHIAACLCTSDGDFATSLFKAYRDKADARYEDMKIVGVKNMPGWNARVMGSIGTRKPEELIESHKKETGFNPIWSEDDIWPRVLFVCDEFQVIFQKADPKNVERIKADITQIAKVARACGMHIFFASQSMKGTISADVLANFSLRFALRCEPEVSNDIIGSTRAAEIKEKNGYLIVKSLEMKTPEEQKRYKTPFLCDDENSGVETMSELFDNMRYLYNKAKEDGFKEREVISYEESTKHPIAELVAEYNDPVIKAKLPKSGVFFLGNRMAYSQNKAPDNIIITAKNNTNIMSCCSDYKDFVMWFNQLMCNIEHNEESGTVIINSQVEDLAYITDASKYITMDAHKYLLDEKITCKMIVDWLYKLLDARKAKEKKDTPVWVFLLGWDKGSGFGVEPDMSLRSRMNVFLQTCGEYHIHVIFINTGMTGIAASTIGACQYTVAAKCSLDDSNALLGNKQASINYEGMPTGWIFSKHDGVISRDKLYISEMTKEIASTEIVI